MPAASKTKKGSRETPLLYLCRSKLSDPQIVQRVHDELKKTYNVEVVKYEGGLEYDAASEEMRIRDCDWMLVVGPKSANGADLKVGKGQMLQVNAFTKINNLCKVLILDEITGSDNIYVSELTHVCIHNPNDFKSEYALFQTNHCYVNINNILASKEEKQTFIPKGATVIIYGSNYPKDWIGRYGHYKSDNLITAPDGTTWPLHPNTAKGLYISPPGPQYGLTLGEKVKITAYPFSSQCFGEEGIYLGGNNFWVEKIQCVQGTIGEGKGYERTASAPTRDELIKRVLDRGTVENTNSNVEQVQSVQPRYRLMIFGRKKSKARGNL